MDIHGNAALDELRHCVTFPDHLAGAHAHRRVCEASPSLEVVDYLRNPAMIPGDWTPAGYVPDDVTRQQLDDWVDRAACVHLPLAPVKFRNQLDWRNVCRHPMHVVINRHPHEDLRSSETRRRDGRRGARGA